MKTLLLALLISGLYFSTWHAEASPRNVSNLESPQRYGISLDALEEEVASSLEQLGAADQVKASLISHRNIGEWSYKTPLHFMFENMRYSNRNGTWQAAIHISSEGKQLRQIAVNGRFETLVDVPVLKSRLGSNDVIEASDIDWITVAESRLRKDTVLVKEQLIGKSPRRGLSTTRPISASELVAPRAVQKNAMIPLIYETANIHIRAMGVTLQEGAIGELIRVRNSDSNMVVHAELMPNGYARITSPQQFAQMTR